MGYYIRSQRGALHKGLFAAITALAAQLAAAGALAAIDPSGPIWQRAGQGLHGEVYALTADGGSVYAGGNFLYACDDAACTTAKARVNRIAKWNGTGWSAVGHGFNDEVRAIVVSGGVVYAGGWFTEICGDATCTTGNVPANRIAKWDGTSWAPVGTGFDSAVFAIAVAGDAIYAGGQFNFVCNDATCSSPTQRVNGIAQWSGGNWSGMGNGFDNSVHALAVDGVDVYAGGTFDLVCGNAGCNSAENFRVNGIARWRAGTWSAMANGVYGNVAALAVVGGELYAGGDFRRACDGPLCNDGATLNFITKWTGAWSPVGNGLSNYVYALASDGSNVYAAGEFTNVCVDQQLCNNGTTSIRANAVARWNGATWSGLRDGLGGYYNDAYAVTFGNGALYAGGAFNLLCGNAACTSANTSVNQVARFAPPSTLATYQIAGKVRNQKGEGLGNVKVVLSGTISGSTTSKADGAYAFRMLPAGGKYSVRARKGTTSFAPRAHTFASLSRNETANFKVVPIRLRADYQFQNTLASSVGDPAPLTQLGSGSGSFAQETIGGRQATVFRFPKGNGLAASTANRIPNGVYTIVLLFRFESTASYRRILDFKQGTTDLGLYVSDGKLNFYNAAIAASVTIQPNQYVQVVLTRGANGVVAGYVNGAPQFSFTDSGKLGVISPANQLRLFQDNTPAGAEQSAGAVARLRLYDGALSAAQVSALDRLPPVQ